ncbi:ester cyclase [Streptomyces sp. NBC_01518]|uniref:ester cyclase n=1 Tax=Streptomyces sp. NBC_01518 TaxID=2903891 RepID=UPI003862D739
MRQVDPLTIGSLGRFGQPKKAFACEHRIDANIDSMLCSPVPAQTSLERHSKMPSQSTESVMNRFVEFINTGNEDLARAVVSPDAVFHAPSHPEPLRGPDGYLEVIGMMRSAFSDVQWTLEETVTEGDTVAARFTMRGTHDGEFFGIPASGNKISVQAMNFYYLADGLIVGERGQPDLLGVMQQIGAVPAP